MAYALKFTIGGSEGDRAGTRWNRRKSKCLNLLQTPQNLKVSFEPRVSYRGVVIRN